MRMQSVWQVGLLMVGSMVLGAMQCHGQVLADVSLDPNKPLTQFHIDAWTTADGLPQNQVSSITQTPDGYLWMLTMEGIVRFDGQQFTRFAAADMPRTASYAFEVAPDGAFWLGSEREGVIRYHEGTIQTWTQATEPAVTMLYAIHVAPDSSVWLATNGGLLTYENDRLLQFTEADGLPSNRVINLASDEQGPLWISTQKGLV